MIKIIKGDFPPHLKKEGERLTNLLKAQYDKFPDDYSTGAKTFDFTTAYKTDEVKTALIECQYNKCCFSEAKFNGDYLHVEHFRPKGRIDALITNNQSFPGYYWLTYEWTNLFICKEMINVSFKKNYFPLVNELLRNKNHHQKNIETPELIDPGQDDPREHIRFNQDELMPMTTRGQVTINLLKLRHSHFEESRRKYFRILSAMKEVIDIESANGIEVANPLLLEFIDILKASVLPSAEFSSMAKDLLLGWPHLE